MKVQKLIKFILVLFLVVLISPVSVSADMGPKDKLTVYVENPPVEPYYLDLLTQHGGPYDNLKDGEDALDADMVEILHQYNNEGWTPALTKGTKIPMWGSLVGKIDRNRMVHEFGYVGVPKTYRIIIVTKSGEVKVSAPYTRKVLQSSVTFDYVTGKVTVTSQLRAYGVQFLTTFSATVLLEGVLLLLFGFRLRDNWKVFFLVNLLTQIVLTVTVGAVLIINGPLAAFLVQFPMELMIMGAEAWLYQKFLIGQSRARRIVYGIAANIFSWIAGFLMVSHTYELITSLL